MSEKDGGPAFITDGKATSNRVDDPDWFLEFYGGMTLRDYFAAQALTMWTNQNAWTVADKQWDVSKAKIAEVCYGLADAMLVERAK